MRLVRDLCPASFLFLSLSACTGVISDLNEKGGSAHETGGSAVGGGSGGGGGTAGSVVAPQLDCKGRSKVGPAPLVRLTNRQYLNTLADLFPAIAIPAERLTLPQESTTGGYSRVADVQAPSATLIDSLQSNAELVAFQVTSDLNKLLPCTPTDAASEIRCGTAFLETFGKQVFRRPLTSDETTRYRTRFEDARNQWGFQAAMWVLVAGLLQSPNFIYRPEFDSAGAVPMPVNSHDLASRLSYFLTDGPPDGALTSAADSGELMDADVVEEQARRLLETPRARALVAEFNRQWLQLDKTKDLVKATDLFPTFNSATAKDLREGVLGWLDRIFWDEGQTLDAFLTDNHALVNDALAPIYGVPAKGSTSLSWTETPTDERSGILTQAGLLSAFAHQRNDAPVRRGVFVLDRLLCIPPPAPPPNVNTSIANAVPGSNLTTRQMLEQTHTVGSCVGCHEIIDGVGFGFGNYDAIGAYRLSEFGQPIDATGFLVGTDVDGPFDGVIELGRKLTESTQVKRCVSAQWLAFALATTHEQLDECVVEPIVRRFVDHGQDLRELLVAVATSDAFRFRPATNPQ